MPTVHFYCVLCGSALQSPSDSLDDLSQCPSCSRYVPVPRRANGPGSFANYAPVFPPDVMELLVKFQCTSCGSALYADARYEGRDVVCTSCGARTRIPRWSNVPDWPRFSEAGQIARMRGSGSSARAQAPALSADEIEFLRGTESRKPEAVA